MILVPRQLQRSGMTGNVPYYGGRFTPAQAYAASHPPRPAPPPPPPPPPPRADPPAAPGRDTEAALRHLRDSGLLTTEEYDDLLTRTRR
jgi:hypothetical protein